MSARRGPRPRREAAARSTSRLPLAIVAAATIGAYWNSFTSPFIWDDQTAIVNNTTIRSLAGAWWPPSETPVAGRPLANVSLALNYAFGGLDVTGYHVVNLAIHVGCALLLFGIVRRTLAALVAGSPADASVRSGGPIDAGAVDAVATVAALLWAVHPLQSEAVNYVTQRTESLMGLFFFGTLYCAIRARRTPARARTWEAAAIGACLLGMATKETMVTAPVVVLLYDRVFEFASLTDAWRARRRLYAGLAAGWILLAALMSHAGRSTVGTTAAITPWTYLLNQAPIVVRYVWLFVWPRSLVLDYGIPQPIALADAVVPALLIGVMLTATVLAFFRWPRLAFLPATFFLTLAPSSSVVPVLTEVGAERRVYVPSAALAVLVAVVGAAVLRRFAWREPGRSPLPSRAAVAAAVAIVAALAVRTMVRTREYGSALTIWRTVVDRRPQGRAHYSLGTELIAAGHHDEGMKELDVAVRTFPEARYAIGTELFAAGRLADAARELQAFIAAQPQRADRVPARLLLGHVSLAQGRLEDAAREFEELARVNPGDRATQDGVSAVGAAEREQSGALVRAGRAAEAVPHARAAVRLLPHDPDAGNMLGVSLAASGHIREAIVEFQRVLEAAPGNQQARNNLARALDLSGGGSPAR